MADTAAALVIQLTAETRQFRQEMRKATGVFDAEGRKIEKRQAQLRKNFEQGFGRFTSGFLSTAAVVGFGRHVLNTADALSDAAQQLGVTTQELQGLDYAARVSGASSEKLSQALSTLADGLGEAQRGEGAMAEAMRRNGIQMGTTIEVLFDVADRVKAARTETEKMNIATTYLGAKGGKSMVSFLNQGADGLRRLREEAQTKGQIWDNETIARLDSAKDSFETMQKALVNLAALPASAFMEQVSRILEMLSGGSVKEGLHALADLAPAVAVGAAATVAGGPVVGIGAGVATYAATQKAFHGGPKPLKPFSGPFNFGGSQRTAVPRSASDIAADAAAALRAAQEVREIVAAAQADVFQANRDARESGRNLVREQNAALLARAQGWSEFSEIQKQVIQSDAALDIGAIESRRDADLQALAIRKAADLQRVSELKDATAAAAKIDQAYADQRTQIESGTAAEIAAIRERLAGDLAQVQTNGIKLADNLREGMLDIGTAALHGFGSMKDAAASALEQIAEMILQMYVLKPLMESIMGPSGTAGQGLVGALLSGIPGFANGTNSAPGGLAVVGERGPELVNLPKGSQVIPHIPQIAARGGAGGSRVDFNIHVTGTTDAEIMRQVRAAVRQGIGEYDRNALPSRVNRLVNDPRLR